MYLATILEAASAENRQEERSSAIDPQDSRLALSRGHHRLFSEWLALPMAAQKSDLAEYLRTAGAPAELRQYRRLIPPGAREVERQLFLADLETLLELFDEGTGASG